MKRMHEISDGAIQTAEDLSQIVESVPSSNKLVIGTNLEVDGTIIGDNALDLGDEETSSGTLTTSQYTFLAANPDAYIVMAGEKYYLAMNSDSGYMNYTCVDYGNSEPIIKVITITVSTLAWVLSKPDVYTEPMSGYSATKSSTYMPSSSDYIGVVKNGNKLTFAVAGFFTPDSTILNAGGGTIVTLTIPSSIAALLYPVTLGSIQALSFGTLDLAADQNTWKAAKYRLQKPSSVRIELVILTGGAGLTADTPYYFRFEETFLLSDNLAA